MKSKVNLASFSRYTIIATILLTAVVIVGPYLSFNNSDSNKDMDIIQEESKKNQNSNDIVVSDSDELGDFINSKTTELDENGNPIRVKIKKAKRKYTQKQIFDRLKDKLWKFRNLKTKKYGRCNNIDKLKEQSKSVSYSAKYVQFKSSNALIVNNGRYISNFLFDEEKQMIYMDVGDNLRETIFSLSGKLFFTKTGFKIIHQAKVDDFNCSPRNFQFLEEYDFKQAKNGKSILQRSSAQ